MLGISRLGTRQFLRSGLGQALEQAAGQALHAAFQFQLQQVGLQGCGIHACAVHEFVQRQRVVGQGAQGGVVLMVLGGLDSCRCRRCCR